MLEALRESQDLRVHCMGRRPLVWTADGRQHPAVTRTLQDAADIAACRNGQQMSANLVSTDGSMKSK